jgi:hypothetical protein
MSNKILISIVAALVLVGALLVSINTTPAIQAAPAAAPTPVASGFSAKSPTELTWLAGVATTADGGSTALNVAGWQVTDIQYNIDQADVNTVTLKLQFSNDNVNWTDGATLVTDNAADASVLSQAAVFGKYARIHANVTNSNPVTLTVIGILK